MIAVTGAAGHLGNVLVRRLCARGEEVNAFILPGERLSSLDGLRLGLYSGDVRVPELLEPVFKGADTVYHLAGFIAIRGGLRRMLYGVNVEGTRNVIKQCLKTGVRRLIYVSSIHAFPPHPPGGVINEDIPVNPESAVGSYGKSKAAASQLVLDASGKLETIVLYPSSIIGPYDFAPSRMGRFFRGCLSGGNTLIPKGGYDFVDVRDAAEGIIAASQKGTPGSSYLISGTYASMKDLVKMMFRSLGESIKFHDIPNSICGTAAFINTLFANILRKDSIFTLEAFNLLRMNIRTDNSKAKEELGFKPRPLSETMADVARWFPRRRLHHFKPLFQE